MAGTPRGTPPRGTAPSGSQGLARAKGSTVLSTLTYLSTTFGDAIVQRIGSVLSATDQQAIETVAPTDEVPYALLVRLWRAADTVLSTPGAKVTDWAEQSGEAAIGSLGVQLYGGILRKPTPLEFLTQSISLFRLYYQPGDMEVVEEAHGRAVLRLVGFDPITTIFCRRQTGGLRQAVALAGGGAARVRHVRCLIEGDAFCEWELHWHIEPVTAGVRNAP